MVKHRISVPYSLDLESSLRFCQQLKSLPKADSYDLDFGAVGWVEPFGMLITAIEIQQALQRQSDCDFYVTNFGTEWEYSSNALSYAAFMGFFQVAGVDLGNKPGSIRGTDKYLPITVLDVLDLEIEASNEFREVAEVIERRARHLSKVLLQQESGSLVDMLTYSLREMMRNIVEHSSSDMLAYCAQYWPRKQQVEVAILDKGVGVRETISRNPHLEINSDLDALTLALVPGVSGKVYDGVPRNLYDVWENSGFGLYLTSRLCGDGGSFFICSGKAGLLLSDGQKKTYSTNFDGTAVRLNINLTGKEALRNRLKRFLKEGDEIAKSFLGDHSITASRASRMLFSDYH